MQLACRVVDVLCTKAFHDDYSTIVSFLLTVLLGHVAQTQLSVSFSRHQALVQAVARAIPKVADPGTEQSLFALTYPLCLQYMCHTLCLIFSRLP